MGDVGAKRGGGRVKEEKGEDKVEGGYNNIFDYDLKYYFPFGSKLLLPLLDSTLFCLSNKSSVVCMGYIKQQTRNCF